MKSTRVIFQILLATVIFSTIAFPKEQDVNRNRLGKSTGITAAEGPTRSVININNIQIWVRRDGFFPWDGSATGTAGEYPKGTAGLIFAEGMLWGAKVNDGTDPRVRVNGCTYASGLKAGKVLYDVDGKVIGSENPNDRHVWRVRTDYQSADLSADAASFYVTTLDNVTEGEITDVYDQYNYDWLNWPAEDGAPYEELNGEDGYQPAVWDAVNGVWVNGDIPGYPGATQTIWLVSNDIPYYVDPETGEETYAGFASPNQDVAPNSYGSKAIGMEMQLTMWAYGFASTNPLGNMLFKRARLIYTGTTTTPETARLDTVYFTQWSDPDLGTYTDDYVGSDTTLSLGYVYNGNTLDHDFNDIYGLPVPAGGYDFLQGPIIDVLDENGNVVGQDTLGMTSFGYFGAGSSISDPDLEEYAGTLQWFNLMEGFLPRPEYPVQTPWTDPGTNEITKYVLSGDPVTGEGWIDGVQLPPGDRRLLLNTGPFEMALGDTQDVVIALIGGLGGDNLSSVTVLKYYDVYAQFAYDNGFELPSPPSKPNVEAFGDDGSITINWGSNENAVSSTENIVQGGFEFEGYKVYQLPSASAATTDGVLIAQFDKVNGVITIKEQKVDFVSGLVLEYPAHLGSDNGIKRYLTIREDKIRNRPITNDRTYYFGVSAYSYLPEHEDSPFKSLESDIAVIDVTPQKPSPEISLYASAADTLSVVKGTTNKSDGSVNPIVLDPLKLTNTTYEVNFNADLTWNLLADNDTILSNMTNQSGDDLYPIIDGIIVKVLGPPLEGKDWDYTSGSGTGNRWFSGAGDGELLYGGAYLGSNFTGSNVPAADYKTVEVRWASIVEAVGTVGLGDTYTVDTSHPNASKAATYKTWGAGNFLAIIDIPFSAYDISDPDNPRQLNIVVRDRDANGRWDLHWSSEDGSVDLQYNYVWITDTDYDEGASWDATTIDEDWMAQVDGDGGPALWALWLTQRGSRDLFQDDGTLTLIPNAVNSPVDVFTFTSEAPKIRQVTETDIDLINVFPNPYYGFHALELTRSGKYVTFNHLPEKATIRIFNMGGVMVKVIEKNDNTQYAKWDLANQFGYPVASGIYIAHIDLPDAGKEKILKIALVQEEQILQNY